MTDTAPALALGFEPAERDIMERPPRSKKAGIFDGGMGIDAVYQGCLFAIATLIAYWYGNNVISDNVHSFGNTMAFLTLCFSQVLHSHVVRSKHSIFKAGVFKNIKLWLATALSVVLMLLVVLTPLLFKILAI